LAKLKHVKKEFDMATTAVQGSRGRTTRHVSRSWPADRKVDLVLEGLRDHRPLTDLCREAGISPVRYCQWRDQFIDAGRAGLVYSGAEANTLEERVKQLEAENTSLQRQLRILQELCLAE
jgi:transposase-like protein